ncbi:hypothetical protein Tco_0236309 [Tanacetum coccineum]
MFSLGDLIIIVSSITSKQTKLDLELVPKEKRLEIGKCNGRINLVKKQREPTFQVVLDDLALTPCYYEILITADFPEVYMHKFWDSIYKYKNSYRFRMDKKKKFNLNLEIFRDIFQICPRVRGQNFDALPTDEDIVSFFKELGHTREINTITDIVVDQMHQLWRTFATIINRSLSGKTTGLDKLRLSRAQILWASPEEPARKSKRVKIPTKNSSDAPTTGVIIRETHVKFLSKKKEKMTVEKRKGIDLLSKVALTKEAHEKGTDSEHETDKNESGSESDQEENEEEIEDDDKEEKEDEFVKTSSNDFDDEDETKIKDKTEGDEDQGMDYATN